MFIQIHAEANYINSLSSDSSRRQQVQEYFPAWRTINRQQWRYALLVFELVASSGGKCLREGTNRVFAVNAGSRRFDSNRSHMSERFDEDIRIRCALRWKIIMSEWRSVIAMSLKVGNGVRLIKPAKLYMCTKNTTNTTRTDTRRRVCAAMFRTAEPLGERRYERIG